MGVWINTVTVTETSRGGIVKRGGVGGCRREKAEKRRVAERLELGGGGRRGILPTLVR